MGRSGGGLTSRKWEAVAHPTWKMGKRERAQQKQHATLGFLAYLLSKSQIL